MNWAKVKRTWRKVWWFIWEDDSWASWFVNIILAFLIIKFIVYPVLGLVLATSHPIVAVVSSSMEHDGSFDEWWASGAICADGNSCTQGQYYDSLGISRDEFRDFRFRNGFNKGDIMVLYGTKPERIEIGDVIVFMANRPDPVIHRTIKSVEEDSKHVFTTKGDHNVGSFYFEAYVPEDNYIGRAVLRIPLLGYIKIGFVKLLQLVGIL
ncbi:signal peptidase I [Candidatus Woesearchaeota archaeon]|nr:signal peptidase I [Candidatus Woesearchaeota archaeon]